MADTTIIPSRLEFDFGLSGTDVLSIVIDVNVLEFDLAIDGSDLTTPSEPTNPELNVYFDCNEDVEGNDLDYPGRLRFNLELFGNCANTWIEAETLEFALDISGDDNVGQVVDTATLEFAFSIPTPDGSTTSEGSIFVTSDMRGMVGWSKIGSLEFTRDQTNEFGFMALKGIGDIYDTIKLNNSVIIYGYDGIAVMKPHGVAWGYEKIFNIGSNGRGSQVGTDQNHWFIDTESCLWRLNGEGIKKIDYKEYLGILSNPVMSLDLEKDLIYICDGVHGFVYSYLNNSLSKGSATISGCGYTGGTSYFCSPSTISLPAIEFTTDIYDMGTRKNKTIFNVEVSTDTSRIMQLAIEYRIAQNVSFSTSPWVDFTPSGIAYLMCYGIEFKFKFKFKTAPHTMFKLDQMKVNGIVHGYSYLDVLNREF